MKIDLIKALGREIGAREAQRSGPKREAHALAVKLRAELAEAVSLFVRTTVSEGADHMDVIAVGPVEPDDKSVRAFQIRITRGRYLAFVVTKDRGEVMLVGPFKRGEPEGPCHAIHLDEGPQAAAELEHSVELLLVRLIEQAFGK